MNSSSTTNCWWIPLNELQAKLEPYQIRRLTFNDFALIGEFETRASDYSLFMTGLLPKPEDALELLSQPNSLAFGVFLEQGLIGILQVLQLEPQIDAIGLLLLEPSHRRKKLATRVFEAYRTWALTRGIRKIVVSVSLENSVANAFWCSLGFEFGVSNPEPASFGGKTQVMQNLEFDLRILKVWSQPEFTGWENEPLSSLALTRTTANRPDHIRGGFDLSIRTNPQWIWCPIQRLRQGF